MGFGEEMRDAVDAPLCGYIGRGRPLPGTNRFQGVPCERRAVLRILLAHGPEAAKYGVRCAVHATCHFGPLVAAVRDPQAGKWVEQPPRRW